MAATYALVYDEEDSGIHSVRFSVASNDETRRMAAAEISDATLYQRSVPNTSGINSLLLGASSRQLRCSTCSLALEECPGHSGFHRLSMPVFAPLFFDTTLKVLRCVCSFCSRLLVDISDTGDDAVVSASTRVKVCRHCGAPVASFAKGGFFGIKRTWSSEAVFDNEEEERFATRLFTPQVALEMLRCTDPEEMRFVGAGLRSPADLVLENLHIPTTAIRPAVSSSTGLRARSQDDISLRLQDVIKRSVELHAEIEAAISTADATTGAAAGEGGGSALGGGASTIDHRIVEALPPRSEMLESGPPNRIRDVPETHAVLVKWARLQAEVMNLVHPTVARHVCGAPKASLPAGVSQRRCLVTKLKGKDGRIRGFLLGKRVDHSARSVISPEPAMDVDEVGVPLSIACTLTVPVRCNAENIEELRDCVLRGAGRPGGAASVIATNGALVSREAVANLETVDLRPGCVVERHLVDGDTVIFNRQPTLWRLGMMAHRVRVVEGDTFRLSLPVTSSYNADFDGDEMNLHVTQSAAATAELTLLMSVVANSANPKTNRCSFGLVQDALLATNLLTKTFTTFHMTRASAILSVTTADLPEPSAYLDGSPFYSSLSLISTCLPGRFSFTSNKFAAYARSLHAFLATANWHSPDTTHSLFGLIEWSKRPVVVCQGVLLCGTLNKKTVGVGGSLLDAMLRDVGNFTFIAVLSSLQRVAHAYMKGRGFSVGIKDVVLPNAAVVEHEICERLVFAVENATEILRAGEERPAVAAAAEATTQQILSRVLLQAADAVQRNVSPMNSFVQMAEAGSKGSKLNLSQISGALGQQIVLGKRILPQKGTRTLPCFDTGTSSVMASGFVQNSYCLGVTPVELFAVAMSGREGLVDTAVKTATSGYLQRTLIKGMEDLQVQYDGTVRTAQKEIVQFAYGNDGYNPARLELCSFADLLKNVGGEADGWARDLLAGAEARLNLLPRDPQVFHELTCRLPIDTCRVLRSYNTFAAQPPPTDSAWRRRIESFVSNLERGGACANTCLQLHVALALDSMRPPVEHEEEALRVIREAVLVAQVEAGEAVGLLAGQSLGEPATQLTLNSFHSAGTGASTSVLHGVPRLKEILSLAKTPRTPVIRFQPADNNCDWTSLLCLRLADVVERTDVLNVYTEGAGAIAGGRRGEGEDGALIECLLRYAELWSRACSACACEKGEPPKGPAKVAVLHLRRSTLRQRHLTAFKVGMALHHSREAAAFSIVAVTPSNSSHQFVAVKATSPRLMGSGAPRAVQHGGCVVAARVACRVPVAGDWRVRAVSAQAEGGLDERPEVTVQVEPGQSTAVLKDIALGNVTSAGGAAEIPWWQCIPNSISEVHELYGVEAAAAVLHSELVRTYAAGGANDIDQRHVSLVVDCMCRSGVPKPFSRHGLNSSVATTGPLVRASFEESVDTLVNASVLGEADKIEGALSSSIMLGVRPTVGTGAFDVLCRLAAGHALPRHAAELARSGAGAAEPEGERILRTCVAAREVPQGSKLGGIAFISAGECTTDVRLRFSSPVRKRKKK